MSFSAYRDIQQKRQKKLDTKQDKQAQFRAVVVDENGLQSGSGSIWASQNKRRVWVMPIGGVQPFQVVCVRITPVIGLGVIVGYADTLSRTLEVLRTDYEFYLETNQVVTAYESPSNEDFLPGGRMQLWLASKMLQPLAIVPQSTGLIVNVVRGYYLYDNQRVLYGGAINVSLVQNPNAGEHYYAGLYLDAANTLQVVYGASVVLATTPPEPAWPDGAFQLGVVRINDTQTSIILSQDTDPLNDVLDRRILWADVDSFGAWPFAHILTVSPTDPSADYTTIGTAITAASAGDVILLDAATYNEAVAINKVLTLIGLGVGSTIITNSGAATITITAANVSLRFLTVNNTSAGATGDCVLLSTSASDVVIDECTIEKVSGAATLATAVHVVSGTNHVILNSKLRCTTGTSRYGLLADTGSSSTTVVNGRCQGQTKDVRTNDASSTVILQQVILPNATASSPSYEEASGSISGNYYLATGNLAYIDNSGVVGRVWLEDTSTQIRKFFPDLPSAIAASGVGDAIYLEAGTYTLASGATISTNGLTIYAASPGSVTITNATASSQTFNVTGDNVTFRNLTITQTGTGGGPTSVVAFEGDNFTLDNCVLTKTGAATLSAGLYQYGGTGAKSLNSFITTSGGTTNYGYYNTIATGAIEVWGGKLSGTQQDIFGDDSGSTVTLYDTILANSLISYDGTKQGNWLTATGQIRRFYPYPSGYQGQATNYVITTSVATSDLTVALKTLAGTDPSVADRISARIGDTVYDITAALSVTALDATNWCNLGAVETATLQNDLFVYLIAETGASAGVKIGFARIPWAIQMGDFTNTSTNANYIKGNWTNFNTTDKVAVIGRFNAILSATAAFTWSLPATSVIINRPIFETRFTTYAAQVTSATGTITTVGTVTSLYQVTGRTLNYVHDVTITTNGTGATSVKVSMPFTPITASVFVGRERGITGDSLTGTANGNTLDYRFYDGTYPGANGAIIAAGGGAFRIG